MKRLAFPVLLALGLAACGGSNDSPTAVPDSGVVEKTDLVVGTGAEAVAGDTLTVHYTGWLADGTKFDSSYDRGTPYVFRLGAGAVIAGWDQGIPGMKVGGKRRLIIPPSLAYGASGRPPTIPGNATLKFEVELLAIAGK
ncbi:MAG: FKBP-type peptidyl-prolyl cis-trans isomerase [Vicinamibacteria bacterium]